MLSNTNWGGDRSVLLNLYRSLVRSKLDYGSIVYGSARKSYLKILDTIHHQGLRLALGAFRTSPVESLYADSNEPFLYIRREKLSTEYSHTIVAWWLSRIRRGYFYGYCEGLVSKLYFFCL